MADYHRVIGIDLGTTFSVAAAYSMAKSDVIVIPNLKNQRTTPSVVYIGKNGQISVGEAARRKLVRDPDGVVIEAKRAMGERLPDGNKKMLKVSGRELEPEFISACILKELKSYAERHIGEPIHDAVITVPAYFKEPQKNATREAARLARLNPRLIVNEPTAAAVAYGLEEEEDSTYIVYDFGGGTFDVSVVRIKDGREFDILGTGGDSNLGGGDIDQRILEWVLDNLRRDYGQDCSGDHKLLGRIRLEAERVKMNLCNEGTEQEFYLEAPTREIEEIAYHLSPDQFAELIRPLLDRTRTEVEVAMNSAAERHSLTIDDLDGFVLVGGSSKMPHVKEMLEQTFKKPVKTDLNPDEIVAIGAARLATDYPPSKAAEVKEGASLDLDPSAVIPEGLEDTQIKDVVSHTLGIGLKDDVYDALIPKDCYIPHRVVRSGYTTAEDNQTSIYVPVYQGDNPKASMNYQLGDVVIDGLPPEPRGTHKFTVTFALDADGIFFGEVMQEGTETRKSIKLQRGHDGLVEKRRAELADAVTRGYVTVDDDAAPQAEETPQDQERDRIQELISNAQKALPDLPAAAQSELTAALAELMKEQLANNQQGVGRAVLSITSILNRYRSS